MLCSLSSLFTIAIHLLGKTKNPGKSIDLIYKINTKKIFKLFSCQQFSQKKFQKFRARKKKEKYESNNAVINEVMNNLLLCIIHHDTPAQTMYFKLELKRTKKSIKFHGKLNYLLIFMFSLGECL